MEFMPSSFRPGLKNTKKSFVLRKGRTTSAQRRALKSLKKQHTIQLGEDKVDFSAAFEGSSKKLIADVGFGSGESLLYMADKFNEVNFVGIEVYPPGIGSALNQIEQNKLTNLKIIESDVFDLLETKVTNETFDAMIFLYPDPWPKRKHLKRRLLSEDFLNLLYDKVAMGGVVFCKTDWEDYYTQVKEAIVSDNRWLREDLTSLPEYLKSLPQTKYEKKAQIEGREPRELLFRKTSG